MTTTSTRPAVRGPAAPGRATISAKTLRNDRWWFEPAYTVVGLSAWLIWGLIHTLIIKNYYFAEGRGFHYLTPFFSPCVSNACTPDAAEFGRFVPNIPLVPYALVSLPFLLLFRLTCYYYRRAYYRSFWASPPACAVPDGHKTYSGETRFPLIFQNAHRYAFYAAAIISLINTYDAAMAFVKADGTFGLGLGNIILWINVIMLWAYTVSCHSCRHIIGGRLKHFSKHPVRYWIWTQISKLNKHHMAFAWISLATLMLSDLYIMLVASGAFSDPRIFN
jgi:hypothetical protein